MPSSSSSKRINGHHRKRWTNNNRSTLGVRLVCARPQPTNTQRIPSLSSACVWRWSSALCACLRPIDVYSTFMRLAVQAQKSRRTQRTTTNAQRWSSAHDERVTNADAHPANDDALAKIAQFNSARAVRSHRRTLSFIITTRAEQMRYTKTDVVMYLHKSPLN